MKVCVCATCPMAGEPQPEWNFYRLSKARDGLQSWCKSCMKGARTRDRHAKPEREREYERRSYRRIKADPERYAVHLEGSRQRKRRALGITPDRYRVGIEPEGMIDVAPIREAVEWSGLPFRELARLTDMTEDAIRKGLKQQKMNTPKALKILEAIDVLPAELGL